MKHQSNWIKPGAIKLSAVEHARALNHANQETSPIVYLKEKRLDVLQIITNNMKKTQGENLHP